ncbi:MAG: hypothetical protein A2355_18530 [Spirochaetes bacterium RIFOXYB1_FULL_32_8]|nr:MAG: hypothetical protein A2Y30_10265 [Spirochaetes bacterium GWE1_32_154]OHD80341.1 MAG: hypothetical protein A2355_18530 [Spirochaetes bacterium RIFOXYB1_FULL_32_8]HBD92707.1 hypothetical protein [Spirochaetia bacterium]HBI39021.1 hypothetical protein [Spirochaetia bacterium]
MSKKQDTHLNDYDSAWKDVIEGIFPDFIKFFYPDAFTDIDWSKGFKFLNKELSKIEKDHETGNKRVDELVEVYLLDGNTEWVYIHIEVQGYNDKNFMKRMYTYNYRIYDKYDKEVVSFAILSDNDPEYKPDRYEIKRWGFRSLMEFPVVKITDYRNRLEELETSDNPMAMVVLATLEGHTAKDNEEKYNVKLNLMKMLLKKGYTKDGILSVLRFIDWIIALPIVYEEKIKEEVDKMEGKPVAYVTSFERITQRKEKENTAINMLKKNYAIEEISDITELSIEEIRSLKVPQKA